MVEKEPCRVCDGFKKWTASSAKGTNESNSSRSNESILKETVESHSSDSDSIRNSIQSQSTKPLNPTSSNLQCPPEGEDLGRQSWTFLHSVAAYYPVKPDIETQQAARSLLDSTSKLYPCGYCAKHLREEIKENPPKVTNRNEFEQWLCDVHNKVNVRLGKSIFVTVF